MKENQANIFPSKRLLKDVSNTAQEALLNKTLLPVCKTYSNKHHRIQNVECAKETTSSFGYTELLDTRLKSVIFTSDMILIVLSLKHPGVFFVRSPVYFRRKW